MRIFHSVVTCEKPTSKRCRIRSSNICKSMYEIIVFFFTLLIHTEILKTEPEYDKTNKVMSASSEDSGQPGHPPSLIRVLAVSMQKHWVLGYP